MIQQKNDQLFYTTEADESTDVKHAAELAVHFCGCNSSRDHYNGLLEKVTEKTLYSKIRDIHFTIHQENP
jgi:predicted nucleotidyltransferase